MDSYVTSNRLKVLFPNAKIIVCTRDKNEMIKSLYSQYIKEGGILTFEKFKTSFFNMNRLDYDDYINHLKHLFGKENVYVTSMEKLKQNHREFVEGICSFIGAIVPEYTNKKLNVSYTPNQLKVQRILNYFFKTNLNPYGLPPKMLWKKCLPSKMIVMNRLSRRILK